MPTTIAALSLADSDFSTSAPTHIVVIDSGVESPEVLINALLDNSRAFVISNRRDGVEQVSEILSQFSSVEHLHIVAHGASGAIRLGNNQLDSEQLSDRSQLIKGWKAALSENAQLSLYSCNVAEGELGKAFIQQLQAVSGLEVAASTGVVGAKQGGGTWQLDYATAQIETTLPFCPSAVENYAHTLPFDQIFQAEDALLFGAVIDSTRPGAQGSYVDYQNPNNDYIEWTVNAPAAGSYKLAWRYANGKTNRPLSFSLNGNTVTNNLSFNGTGSWNTWSLREQTVDLQAGVNKIRLRATGSSGGNFDYLRVTEIATTNDGGGDSSGDGGSNSGDGGGNSNPPSNVAFDQTFQAEDALLSGPVIDSTRPGAQGSYVDYQNSNNDYIEWTVNAPAAGSYKLAWRYANGSTNRPLSFLLNGNTVTNNLSFNGTGNWNTWSLREQTVDLNAGVNKIRLRANGSSGGNFDYLRVTNVATDNGGNDGGNSGGDGGDGGDGGSNPPSNVTSTTGVGRIEAENMTLDGFTVENSSISSGLKVINAQATGKASTRFTGTAGTYDLVVAYHDENDGQSPASVRVDGQLVDSWAFNENTDSTIASRGNLRRRVISGVSLNSNSVIEIQGSKNQNEFARVDYLEINAPSNGGGDGGDGGGPSGPPIRVLALGDSNTRGEGTPGGYRTQFWQRSVSDGVAIDFLGTRSGGPDALGDKDHQGQGGWSIPQMISWVRAGNLAAQNPDIIMFMMGTNDANTNGAVSGAQIRDRLSTLIDEVASAVSNATLFVSSIMPLDTPRGTAAEAQAASDFNALIPALVNQKAAEGKKVIFADAGGRLTVGDVNGDNSATDDSDDGLHATSAGYDKLGNLWYNAVSQSSVWQNAVAVQNGSGSALSSALTQSTDPITGDGSNNVLVSNTGSDTLIGGGGQDVFVYAKPADGFDVISDFSGNDTIRVLRSGFGGDLVAGAALTSNDFVRGGAPSAKDGGSTFLFNVNSKVLSFDVDGTGSTSAVDIARLSNGFDLVSSQIEIV